MPEKQNGKQNGKQSAKPKKGKTPAPKAKKPAAKKRASPKPAEPVCAAPVKGPNELSFEDKERLEERLVGTCDSVESAVEFLELDVDAAVAEDGLLDRNVERCKGCDWWHHSYDLTGERDGEEGYCEQCADPAEGE